MIDHGFYPLLAMVYKCFSIESILSIYRFRDDLEESGNFVVFWSPFECRAAQTHQIFSYVWRSSHR